MRRRSPSPSAGSGAGVPLGSVTATSSATPVMIPDSRKTPAVICSYSSPPSSSPGMLATAPLLEATQLEPGDVALWNLFTVHGSGPNSSDLDRRFYLNGYVRAEDCDRGEWAFRDGEPCSLGEPVLVHYEELHSRPEPHFLADR